MAFNLTTDDVYDERERLGLNKKKKPTNTIKAFDKDGYLIAEGKPSQVKGKVQKYYGKTSRYSKRGKWRKLIEDDGGKIIKNK